MVNSGGMALVQRRRKCVASGLVALAVAMGLAIAGDSAFAASTCTDLDAELSRLRSGPSPKNAKKAAKYQREWTKQSAALARQRSKARRASCSGRGFLFFRSKPQPACGKIVPRLNKLKASVAKLDRQRRKHSSAGSSRNRLAQVRRMMRRINCFGSARMASMRNRSQLDAFISGNPGPYRSRGYTFRTLCVRACDGYYFPISFSTTRNRFAADQATCEALCPGAPVDLYYHDDPRSASVNMVSLSGVPYEKHPAAFRHQSKYDKSCSCKVSRPPISTAAGKSPPSGADEALLFKDPNSPGGVAYPAIPIAKAGFGEDPETLINRAGNFQIGAITSRAGIASPTSRNGQPVRIVGPAHWSDRAAEGVVLTPVPN